MNKNEILNYLKNQKSYLQKEFGLTKIGLFRSCARDENMETSKDTIEKILKNYK